MTSGDFGDFESLFLSKGTKLNFRVYLKKPMHKSPKSPNEERSISFLEIIPHRESSVAVGPGLVRAATLAVRGAELPRNSHEL